MKKNLLKSKLKQIFLKHKLSKNHAEICSSYLVKAEILGARGVILAQDVKNYTTESGTTPAPDDDEIDYVLANCT